MRIAFNCWVLRNRELDGIGNFTVEVVSRIIKNNPEYKFDVLVDRKFRNIYFNYPNVKLHRIFPALRHPILYILFLEIVLPIYLKFIKPDLLVAPDGFLSLMSKVKQLPVIHDLNFEEYPENLPLRNRLYYRFFFRSFVHKAERVITVSEYSKKDISERYGYPSDKIDVVYSGVCDWLYPCTEDEKKMIRRTTTNGNEYFLFVGTMHPRKNILRLINAFGAFKRNINTNIKLVLAGNIMWDDGQIKAAIKNNFNSNNIICAGRVSNDGLRLLIGGAIALVFVPVFEGFGLPIVEAWQCDTPLIASNVTSIPEIANNAAMYVDPFDVDDIAYVMKSAMNDNIRAHYIQMGKARRTLYSWDRTAKLLYNSIQKIINKTK